MPRQKGPLFITGTYNGMCYYEMNGEYYVRRKSSLSARRVKGSPEFRRTMRNAGLLAQAAKIATEVYRVFPLRARKREIYQGITGKAMTMLKKGMDTDTVKSHLQAEYAPLAVLPPRRQVEQPQEQRTPAAPSKVMRLVRRRRQNMPPGNYHVAIDGALKLNMRSLVRSGPAFFRDACASSMKRGRTGRRRIAAIVRAPAPV